MTCILANRVVCDEEWIVTEATLPLWRAEDASIHFAVLDNLRAGRRTQCDRADELRRTPFVCAVALCTPSGEEIVEHGKMNGRILRAPQGEGGFGYDPLFVADDPIGQDAGHTLSTAQLTPADKDAISHRGKALRAIAPHVAGRWRA